MTVYAFAAPYAAPEPPGGGWTGLRITWEGFDGSVWELTDYRSGLCLVAGGVVGLHMPEFQPFVSESPSLPGQRRRGVRTRPRAIELPVLIWHDESTAGWAERDSQFWRSMSPTRPGLLTVTSGTTTRTIRAVLESDGGHAFDLDPHRSGWQLYQLTLTADQPYWVGEQISQRWVRETPVMMFNSGTWPPLLINKAAALESAVIANPGAVAAWARWTVVSELNSSATLTATVNGGPISFPCPANRVVVVDTDPAVGLAGSFDQAAWNANPAIADDLGAAIASGAAVDVSASVDPWSPRPVPSGARVPLNLQLVGQAAVHASLRPRYYRAF